MGYLPSEESTEGSGSPSSSSDSVSSMGVSDADLSDAISFQIYFDLFGKL